MVLRDRAPSDSDRLSRKPPENPLDFALAFGALAVVALGHAFHDVLEGAPWLDTVAPLLITIAQMIALTLGYRWLRERCAGRIIMAAAGALVSVVFGVVFILSHTGGVNLLHAMEHGIPAGLAFGGFWALVFVLPKIVRAANLRSLAADGIRREAELAQLRSSLQPHFLLNTLHAVSALVVDEPLIARRLLAALGDLLRDALESGPEIRPLAADINWLQRYAEILEVRHRDALRFEWDIAPETTTVRLPKLLLQPLLENAVNHGALGRPNGGVVILRSRFTDGALQLVVEDNGPGMAPGTTEGLGLRIVRERTGIAHPDARFGIESSPAGTCAIIEVPFPHEVP